MVSAGIDESEERRLVEKCKREWRGAVHWSRRDSTRGSTLV
jgi:hypothetical protein